MSRERVVLEVFVLVAGSRLRVPVECHEVHIVGSRTPWPIQIWEHLVT